MGLQILDGLGRGFSASVDDEGHLTVDSIALTEMAHQSDDHGLAFSMVSTYVTTAVNREMVYLQNDAEENMHIENLSLASSIVNIATILEVTGGTPAGTTISPQNLNLISGVAKSFTAFGNGDVAVLTGNSLWAGRVPISQSINVSFSGALILGTGDGIAVSWDIAASVEVVIFGYWDV